MNNYECPYSPYCNLKKIDSQRCADYEGCESYLYFKESKWDKLGADTLIDFGRLEEEINEKN